jgi:hypothetical protein
VGPSGFSFTVLVLYYYLLYVHSIFLAPPLLRLTITIVIITKVREGKVVCMYVKYLMDGGKYYYVGIEILPWATLRKVT